MRDVVSLSAFPKSGVTYLGFLLFHCVFGQDHEAELADYEKTFVIDIHAYPDAPFARPEPPHFIKSHYSYRPDRPFVDRTAKAIYLIRHPIDVMMSAWDFGQLVRADGAPPGDPTTDPAFRAHLRAWLETGGAGFDFAGTWVEHVRSWLGQTDIPVLLVTYGDLVDHPRRELARILAFLDLTISDERQALAIERSSMRAMAQLEDDEVREHREGVFFSPRFAAGFDRGRRFINKGYRDSYRTVLTDEERAMADQRFGAALKAHFSEKP
ncbi:MAG: sulfotransferase domain-containing protein [Alphaproteobacteria bacterium]|nr:sulfotransferase domain-containing protein [Alphaproteobacteria bacterium]MBF0332465.1 sulfotransferase domain-containing protein [Alphaproteobacteria bacterium]